MAFARRGLFKLFGATSLAATAPSVPAVAAPAQAVGTYWSAFHNEIRSQTGVKVRVWFIDDGQWSHWCQDQYRTDGHWHCSRVLYSPEPPANWTHGLTYYEATREWRNY